jgi:hypothetical protein
MNRVHVGALELWGCMVNQCRDWELAFACTCSDPQYLMIWESKAGSPSVFLLTNYSPERKFGLSLNMGLDYRNKRENTEGPDYDRY